MLSLSFSSEYPKSIKENLQNEKNKYEINYLFFAIVLGYSLTYGMFGCYSLLHLDDDAFALFAYILNNSYTLLALYQGFIF